MRLSLAFLFVAVFLHSAFRTPHSAFAEIFARWQFERLGEHALPLDGANPRQWSVITDGLEGSFYMRADFSGIVAGPRGAGFPADTSSVFNVHTGELFDIFTELGARGPALDVDGTKVLTTDRTLYDAATGVHFQIAGGQTVLLNPQGEVLLSTYNRGGTDDLNLELWPSGQVITSPYVVVLFEGVIDGEPVRVTEPAGELHATDFSGEGWVTGWVEGAGLVDQEGQSVAIGTQWVANARTGEFRTLHGREGYEGVINDHGQTTGIERAIIDYDREPGDPLPKIIPHPRAVLNNAGQLAHALALDDAGRVLVLRRIEDLVVDVPGDLPIHYEQFELAVGEPVTIAGDLDASGGVGQGDLDVVLLNWGSTERPEAWVHDTHVFGGLVDQSALDRVLLRWGASDGAVLTRVNGASVPEPSAMAIAALLLLAWAAARFTPRGGLWPRAGLS